MAKQKQKRPNGRELKPGFASKLFLELLVAIRTKKKLVTYLNEDLGIGWRNLCKTHLHDITFSILIRIILNYTYQTDREEFVAACAELGGRIYDYSDRHLDDFNNQNIEDPEE